MDINNIETTIIHIKKNSNGLDMRFKTSKEMLHNLRRDKIRWWIYHILDLLNPIWQYNNWKLNHSKYIYFGKGIPDTTNHSLPGKPGSGLKRDNIGGLNSDSRRK